jgi:hypothetical protein
MVDGRLIKLQNTAMKHLNKDINRFQFQMEKNHSVANKPKHANVGNHHETSKENHRPRSNSMGIAQYTKGVSVVILGTENTIHRFPGMVGVVGVIHEVCIYVHGHMDTCIYIYIYVLYAMVGMVGVIHKVYIYVDGYMDTYI